MKLRDFLTPMDANTKVTFTGSREIERTKQEAIKEYGDFEVTRFFPDSYRMHIEVKATEQPQTKKVGEKMRVLSQKEIETYLNDGYVLRYATIQGKVYIQDCHWNKIGSVRFETYLRMVKGLTKIKTSSTTDELYAKA